MANIESIIYSLQYRDRSKDRVVTSEMAKASNKYTVFDLILVIVNFIVDAGHIIPEKARPYLKALQKHFGFHTIEEASLLCAFFNLCDDTRIRLRDIAQMYKVHSLDIMYHSEALDDLVKRKFIIRRRESEGNTMYRITEEVIQQIRNGDMPHPKDISGLDVMQFCTEIDDLLNKCSHGEIDNVDFEESLGHLIRVNKHLHIAKTLLKYDLDFSDMLLLLVFMSNFINKHDDNITKLDIEDYFNSRMLRHHCYFLETGNHSLMSMKLVEYSCSDGQISPTEWKLTEETKLDLLKELNLKNASNRANLTLHEKIVVKKLYYNDKVAKQIMQLQSLLKPRRMKTVLQALESCGMRKGFTCIFYGSPGTGKTETVRQLARITKRDIMMVDIPNIRSKWVGDSEKNIKRVFDTYHCAVRANPSHAPILLFNEADAILNKRNEGGTSGVDKMENALQNIILQEMENLEGIMIATTNLTGNLDAAFERRFLYKIEFDKPGPKERHHIWKTMLPFLSNKQAMELSEKYDFSGGQIENISRKRIVSVILNGDDKVDMVEIINSCDNELINKKTKKIGYS